MQGVGLPVANREVTAHVRDLGISLYPGTDSVCSGVSLHPRFCRPKAQKL